MKSILLRANNYAYVKSKNLDAKSTSYCAKLATVDAALITWMDIGPYLQKDQM